MIQFDMYGISAVKSWWHLIHLQQHRLKVAPGYPIPCESNICAVCMSPSMSGKQPADTSLFTARGEEEQTLQQFNSFDLKNLHFILHCSAHPINSYQTLPHYLGRDHMLCCRSLTFAVAQSIEMNRIDALAITDLVFKLQSRRVLLEL